MKKSLKYLQWLPFAICLGSLIIYLVYTIQIKVNPTLIVTDKLLSTLKLYLIIALISLVVGLLIILVKKIRNLLNEEETEIKTINEEIKEEKIEIKEEPQVIQEKEEIVETVKEEKNEEYNFELDSVACPSCSGIISKDAGICPHCGVLFDDEILRVIRLHQENEKIYAYKQKPMVKIANVLLTILFIILIFLIIVALNNKRIQNSSNILPNIIEKQSK